MIDGVSFIRDVYPAVSNSNDQVRYRDLYHPDILWCPPNFPDKRGVDIVAFAYGLKDFHIYVEVLELEGIDSIDMSYVTGLVKVDTFRKDGKEQIESLVLRGSWLIVEHKGRPCIKYQVWNQK